MKKLQIIARISKNSTSQLAIAGKIGEKVVAPAPGTSANKTLLSVLRTKVIY